MILQRTAVTDLPMSLSLLTFLSLSGCGGRTAFDSALSGGLDTGATASHPAGGAGGTSGGSSGASTIVSHDGGSTGNASVVNTGTSVAPCADWSNVDPPTLSTDCAVTVRQIDPTFTCTGASCAIVKALDLTCASLPQGPWLSATMQGAVVMTRASGKSSSFNLTRLMTVEEADNRVQDVPALADPSLDASAASAFLADSVLVSSSSGTRWLFVGDTDDITVVRGTDNGWTRMIVPSPLGPSQNTALLETLRVTDVCMVDDNLGFLTYSQAVGLPPTVHLATWDGSCWSDQTIGTAWLSPIHVTADSARRPWVAWVENSRALNLRSPSGDVQNLLAEDAGVAPAWDGTNDIELRLLSGGLDGTWPMPAVAGAFTDGIRVLTNSSTSDAAWHSTLLPASAPGATITGDCPPEGPSSAARICSTKTSCAQQLSGISSGFDLARTQSGVTFVAWVEYSSEGNYSLSYYEQGGEMPMDYCFKHETSGEGTANLVVARLAESGTVTSRFRFDMGGAVASLSRKVAMTARGDTLLVAAYLSGDLSPTLTYLEIDSRLLP